MGVAGAVLFTLLGTHRPRVPAGSPWRPDAVIFCSSNGSVSKPCACPSGASARPRGATGSGDGLPVPQPCRPFPFLFFGPSLACCWRLLSVRERSGRMAEVSSPWKRGATSSQGTSRVGPRKPSLSVRSVIGTVGSRTWEAPQPPSRASRGRSARMSSTCADRCATPVSTCTFRKGTTPQCALEVLPCAEARSPLSSFCDLLTWRSGNVTIFCPAHGLGVEVAGP